MVYMYMAYICVWRVHVYGAYVYGEMVYMYMYMVTLSAGAVADFRRSSGTLNMIYDGCDKVLVFYKVLISRSTTRNVADVDTK